VDRAEGFMPIAFRAAWLLLVAALTLASFPVGVSAQGSDDWVHLLTAASQADCPSEPVGGFGRIWSSEPGVRERLGCPTGPEAPVDIRMRRDRDALGIWVEDDSDVWFEVSTPDQTYRRHAKQSEADFWQARPYGVMVGAAQQFENGTMVVLPGDGTRVILVLDSSGRAQELLD
jgi:hypothetical protein